MGREGRRKDRRVDLTNTSPVEELRCLGNSRGLIDDYPLIVTAEVPQ